MQQPSAQGIASLYMGNPGALQQRIQNEQKGQPGLPPDLQKMLALQIVTNENNAAAKQKALQQLQQMGGQQGQPPTVMQSLQQQAQQKLQAQATQAQRQQQGLQALMQRSQSGEVPENTPQPEIQPEAQGIDQLPAEFQMAGGGLVAFKKGGEDGEYETPYDRMNRENREKEEADLADREATIRENNGATMPYGEQMSRLGKSVSGGIANALKTLVSAPGYGLSKDEPRPAPAAMPAIQTGSPEITAGPAPAPASAQARDLQQLAAQKAAQRVAAPAMPAAPVAPVNAAPAAQSDAMRILSERLKENPRARQQADVAEFERIVGGAPDTSQHDRLIAELERRKQELAPKQGYEGLMEYLGEISRADSRGRGSFAAGAAGAARLSDLNKERQGQQFELSKQAIDISQKKLDTVRAYAEKKYGIGKNAFDQVYKDQHDAAKEIVKDEQAARQLAQENTLKRLELENRIKVAGIQQSASPSETAFIRDWLAKPENKGATYSDAYTAYKNTGLAAKEPQTRASMIQKYAESWNKMEPQERINLGKQGITTREGYIEDMLRISGIGAGSNKDTSGKVPPPPTGFKLN